MVNTILTIGMITREAVRLWYNSNSFIQAVDTQYDDQFARTGAKIGSTLRIRLPNDYTVRRGTAVSVQSTTEQSIQLVLADQRGVDVSFSTAERTMSLDDYSTRVLGPMVNNLVGDVAASVIEGCEAGTANFVANLNGGGVVLSPTSQTWLEANAILTNNSAPKANRQVVLDPFTMARTVSSLSGLFNPQSSISKQYMSGQMYDALNFIWSEDPTVVKHTTGAYGALPTVAGANQTGLQITTTAFAGPLNVGDIITFEDVNAVNRVTKRSTGMLRQFVVTAAVQTGDTIVHIYPALIPAGPAGQQVQYQTVDLSPDAGATMDVVTNASTVYRKNLAFSPDAVTLATADLELPRGVHEAAREQYDGVSMRMVTDYDIGTDQMITRLDVLFGYLWIRPEWVVAVGDSIA